jgi:hypothetical protein
VGAGALGGFAGGFAGAAINGATFEQSLRAGAIGAATGAAFGYVGSNYAAGSMGNYTGHAVIGCASSMAQGGNCEQGAAAALVGKWVTNNTSGSGWNDFTRGIAAVVSGGVGSMITGGSFENGAKTAAYGYLFNQMSRPRPPRIGPGLNYPQYQDTDENKAQALQMRADAAAMADTVSTGAAYAAAGCAATVVCAPAVPTLLAVGTGAGFAKDLIFSPNIQAWSVDAVIDVSITYTGKALHVPLLITTPIAEGMKNSKEAQQWKK